MSTYLLAAFLLLYGVNIVLGSNIPGWVLGCLAIAAGLLLLIERTWGFWRPKPPG